MGLLEVLPEMMEEIVRAVVLGTSAFSLRAVSLGTDGEAVCNVDAFRGELTPSLRISSLLPVPLDLPFFFPAFSTESIMDTLKEVVYTLD